MTSDALLIVQTLFSSIWRLFTSWHIPGTQVSPAGWALFSLLFALVCKLFMFILGLSKDDSHG